MRVEAGGLTSQVAQGALCELGWWGAWGACKAAKGREL